MKIKVVNFSKLALLRSASNLILVKGLSHGNIHANIKYTKYL